MSTLKILLNIALCLFVTNAKPSLANHYSNVPSNLYKKAALSHDRPLVMAVDEISKNHDRNDHHMTYSQKRNRNDLDNSADSSAMNDDVPYSFLYLYKLLQKMKNKYNKQNVNNKHDSVYSSVGTNRKPSYHNRDSRNNRWGSDRSEQYNERHRQRYYRNEHKYEDDDDRDHKYEDDSYSHRNHRYRHNHDNRYHKNVDDRHDKAQDIHYRLSGMNYDNHHDSDKRHYHDHDNRYHSLDESHHYGHGDRYHKNEHNNRYHNSHNNRYHNTHDRHHNRFYNNDRYDRNRDLHSSHADNRHRSMENGDMTNRLSDEDKEILKLEQNIVKSPLVKTLLGISNSLRQRKPKDSCESNDTCEETTIKNVTDDPCEENSNSCGEDEDKNPSTRGIVHDYVSDPPPKMC